MRRSEVAQRPVTSVPSVASILMIIAALSPSPSAAQVDLLVDSRDEPLRLTGRLDEETDSFSRQLRVTAVGGDIDALDWLAFDLVHVDDPAIVIDRSNVQAPVGISLSEGRPRDVMVTVDNVSLPGTYRGTLEFPLPGSPPGRTRVVEIVAEISEEPSVRVTREARTVSIVRCRGRLYCSFAGLLVPGRIESRVEFLFENDTRVEVEVESVWADLIGTKTGQGVERAALAFDSLPAFLPANGIGVIAMTVESDRLSPDTYQGNLGFSVDGAESGVRTGLTLNVRAGPGWAVAVLLFGLAIGRLQKRDITASFPSGRAASFAKFLGVLINKSPEGTGVMDFLRMFVFLVILLALLALGMTTLYAGNLAFGAEGLNDYLGLFLFGFGADVAQLKLNEATS